MAGYRSLSTEAMLRLGFRRGHHPGHRLPGQSGREPHGPHPQAAPVSVWKPGDLAFKSARRAVEEKGRMRHSQADERRSRPHGSRSRRARRIVVLLGIDGAGKTTTAEALADVGRESGRSAIVLRNRSGRRWLARVSARCGLELPVRWADRFETVVRTANVAVSQVRAIHQEGLVIIDRHLVCQLVLRQGRGLPPGRVLPWLAARSIRPYAVVVLDVSAQIAQQRILRRGEDHESLDYLQTARTAYLELARTRGWRVVDATATTDALVAQIAAAIDL
ncbi:UNVERIFIED_CONTAM: dTMP kinase [Kocuria sp. CPCC 205316]|uniref:dTMP kinase n=1 Tax=Kocuria TaxID=57493 RepID=UPI0036D92D78